MPATLLILAGRRGGKPDPLAVAAGVADKCLVPVAGKPMLAHVLAAAIASDATRIIICGHAPMLAVQLKDFVPASAAGRLHWVNAADNLADSVLGALKGAAFPALVTTADACLLTPATIGEMDAAAAARGADAIVALARKADVLAAHPDGQRRFYRFADVEVSNCNAYWIGNAGALRAAEAFRGGGQFIKKPVRVLRAFGLINLIRFRLGLGPLHRVFDQLGRHMGLRLIPVLVRDGAAAIDVDNERSLRVTEAVMAARKEQPGLARAA